MLWNKPFCCATKTKVPLPITCLTPNDLYKCKFTILFVKSKPNYHLQTSTRLTSFLIHTKFIRIFTVHNVLYLFIPLNFNHYLDYPFHIFFSFTKSIFLIIHFHFKYYLYFHQAIIHFLNYLILIFITLIIYFLFTDFQHLLNYYILVD